VRGGGGEILANNLTYPILTQGGLQIWKMLMEQLRTDENLWSSILALSVDILYSQNIKKKLFMNVIILVGV
jgi:hypothetical protein